ncbi:MAG: hypothetical protein ACREJU_14935 [Nitrospiraceae bacterium]
MTMRSRGGNWLVCLCLFLGSGCGSGTRDPLDLTTLDPAQDQRQIANHYHHEAILLRQKANELLSRAAVYEPLFGADSEWIKATRVLALSYEEAAREHERLADQHLWLTEKRVPLEPAGSMPR